MLLEFTPTFIWVAINLLILYLVMKKLLFKPVTGFMEKRIQTIKDSIDNAEKTRSEANELKKKYEEQLKAAKAQADRILEDARARAGKEYDSVISAAKSDAEALMARARAEMERERDQMLKDLKSQVAGLALSVASKVIEANMDTDKNRELADKFIDEAGAA